MRTLHWIWLSVLCYYRVAGRLDQDPYRECIPKEAESALQDCHEAFISLPRPESLSTHDMDCCIYQGTKSCFEWKLSTCDYRELFKMAMLTNEFGYSGDHCTGLHPHCQAIPDYDETIARTHSVSSLQMNNFVLQPDPNRSPKSADHNSSETGSKFHSFEEHSENLNSSSEGTIPHVDLNGNSTVSNNTLECSGSDANCSREPKAGFDFGFPAGHAGVIAPNTTLFDPSVHAVDAFPGFPLMNLTAFTFPHATFPAMNMTPLSLPHATFPAMNMTPLSLPAFNRITPMNFSAMSFPAFSSGFPPMNMSGLFRPFTIATEGRSNESSNSTRISTENSTTTVARNGSNVSSKDTPENEPSHERGERALEHPSNKSAIPEDVHLNSSRTSDANAENGTGISSEGTSENETKAERWGRDLEHPANMSSGGEELVVENWNSTSDNESVPERSLGNSSDTNVTTDHMTEVTNRTTAESSFEGSSENKATPERSERALNISLDSTNSSMETGGMDNETYSEDSGDASTSNFTRSQRALNEPKNITESSNETRAVNMTVVSSGNDSVNETRSKRSFSRTSVSTNNASKFEELSDLSSNITIENESSSDNTSRSARHFNETDLSSNSSWSNSSFGVYEQDILVDVWVQKDVWVVSESRGASSLSEPWMNATYNETRGARVMNDSRYTSESEEMNFNQSSNRTERSKSEKTEMNATSNHTRPESPNLVAEGNSSNSTDEGIASAGNSTREERILAEDEGSENTLESNNSSMNASESDSDFDNTTREGRSLNLNLDPETRQGRTLSLEENPSYVQLDRKDVLDLFHATSRFVELMTTDCSERAQEELRLSLKQMVMIMCSNDRQLCTMGRQPRQNDLANWFSSLMGTSSSTTTSTIAPNSSAAANNTAEGRGSQTVNRTSNITDTNPFAGLGSFPPIGGVNLFAGNHGIGFPNATLNMTDPSTLARLVNSMEKNRSTEAPNLVSSTPKDTDFIFSSASSLYSFSSVTIFGICILSS